MHKPKILCVDDTHENLEILLELLSNYDVVISLNAQNALNILEKQSVDMILLDIMMPEVDGFTLAQQIKAQEKLKNIPILFISSKTDEASIEKGYEVGGVDYVSKPFKPKELLARVKTHLKLSSLVQNLETEVEETLQKQRYQEHLLIKQSYAAAMGQMVDVIAHQWKQPLNVINMRISNLLLDYEDMMIDEDYVKNFQQKSLHQIRHLVETLNNFRSFMSPHKKMQIFSVQKMLHGSITLIQDELELHHIAIEIDKSEDFTIDAIENEFMHIVLNILNNAKEVLVLKEIERPKITIEVDPKNYTINISDNGLGIEQVYLDTIFDLNFTSKRSTGGSGLGLYMSKMIIQKYGGEIKVSNVEDGARFSILIEPSEQLIL